MFNSLYNKLKPFVFGYREDIPVSDDNLNKIDLMIESSVHNKLNETDADDDVR